MSTVCVVSGERYYKGLSSIVEADVEAALTLPNPEWFAKQRYSRSPQWACQGIPKFLGFAHREKGALRVPRGFILPYPCREAVNVTSVDVTWPQPLFQPRRWQQEMLDHWNRHKHEAIYDYTCESPPGSGKTVGGLFAGHTLGQRTLVLVHTDAILRAWQTDAKAMFGGQLDVGVIKGSKRKIGEHLTIGMVQTLKNRDPETWAELFGLIIVDECHHSPARTVYDIVRNSATRYRFGLTATPNRADKLDPLIEWTCGPIRTRHSKDTDDTVPVKVYQVSIPAKLAKKGDPTKPQKNSFTGKMEIPHLRHPTVLERQQNHVDRLRMVCWLVNYVVHHPTLGGPAVVMTMRTEYNQLLYDELTEVHGISCEVMDASWSVADRDDYFDRADDEYIPVTIATNKMLAEGANVTAWKHMFLVQSFSDKNLVRQSTGRVERRYRTHHGGPDKPYRRWPTGTKRVGYVWDIVDDHRTARLYAGIRSQTFTGVTSDIKRCLIKPDADSWRLCMHKEATNA